MHRFRSQLYVPELGKPRQGKVRDIYEGKETLTLIASDRISVFDTVLEEPIPDKGRLLTELSCFWFDKTKDIVPNHLLKMPDPNVMVVKKCRPIMVEMIVRGYITGSLWRDYASGKRVKCGIPLPDGLNQNDPLPHPIVTPTTKSHEGHDEDITKEELIKRGLATEELWEKLEKTSLALYERGRQLLDEKGVILVDTKYEFGIDAEGDLCLIDEVHTPDSSRFWFKKDIERREVKFPDKEFARQWCRSAGFSGDGKAPALPQEVIEKVRQGYRDVYETITGLKFDEGSGPVADRLVFHLKKEKMIQGVFTLIITGSEKDQSHVDKITKILDGEGIPWACFVASAHKTPTKTLEIIEEFNQSLEPVVCITVAGMSNALSGLVAANLKWPVIACPPFKDHADYLTNIHSSIQMPSNVPAMTVVNPANAALATIKILKTMEMKK